MIAADETLQEIARLAGMIPGIAVRGQELSSTCARIKFIGKEVAAVDAMQKASLAANASVEPWLEDLPSGAASEQTLSVTFQQRDGLEFGELQILGIHLAWHLNKIGLLPSAEANCLLSKWGAAPVGA